MKIKQVIITALVALLSFIGASPSLPFVHGESGTFKILVIGSSAMSDSNTASTFISLMSEADDVDVEYYKEYSDIYTMVRMQNASTELSSNVNSALSARHYDAIVVQISRRNTPTAADVATAEYNALSAVMPKLKSSADEVYLFALEGLENPTKYYIQNGAFKTNNVVDPCNVREHTDYMASLCYTWSGALGVRGIYYGSGYANYIESLDYTGPISGAAGYMRACAMYDVIRRKRLSSDCKFYNKLNKTTAMTLRAYAYDAVRYQNDYTDFDGVSNVLDDLQNDSSFDVSSFRRCETDYNVTVLSIGEDVERQLYVYTYQPATSCPDLNTINMSNVSSAALSLEDGEKLNYLVYNLRCVSRNGVFRKYYVVNYTVSEAWQRFYDISSVMRPFDKDSGLDRYYDTQPDYVDAVHTVASCWEFVGYYNSNSKSVFRDDISVVNVTSKFDGYVRLPDGYGNLWSVVFGSLTEHVTDVYFVAFNTDYDIDDLLEADVWFKTVSERTIITTSIQTSTSPGREGIAYLDYTQKTGNTGDGVFGHKYIMYRIMTSSEFLSEISELEVYNTDRVSSDKRANISNKSWVLLYAECPVQTTVTATMTIREVERVAEETILRLKFVDGEGITYNLGAIDGKTVPPITPTLEVDNDARKAANKVQDDTRSLIQKILDFLATLGEIVKWSVIVIAAIAALILVVWIVDKVVHIFKRGS